MWWYGCWEGGKMLHHKIRSTHRRHSFPVSRSIRNGKDQARWEKYDRKAQMIWTTIYIVKSIINTQLAAAAVTASEQQKESKSVNLWGFCESCSQLRQTSFRKTLSAISRLLEHRNHWIIVISLGLSAENVVLYGITLAVHIHRRQLIGKENAARQLQHDTAAKWLLRYLKPAEVEAEF